MNLDMGGQILPPQDEANIIGLNMDIVFATQELMPHIIRHYGDMSLMAMISFMLARNAFLANDHIFEQSKAKLID